MTSARVECRGCHAHVRARFGGAQDRQVMLTCLVCGSFDLYTSADLLPVARSSPTLLTVVLDLAEAARTTAAAAADDLDALSLLLAGRPQRAEG